MINAETLQQLRHFAATRWCLNFRDRGALEQWQRRQIQAFIRNTLPKSAFYRNLSAWHFDDLPLTDKATMMANFSAFNTRAVELDAALAVALKAETSRDFSPEIDDLTVGLSSGTSGNRGVFLVSRKERQRWAGILLARAMPTHLLEHVLRPWQAPLRIAFFLRANSNLYMTLNSRRIDFAFYDLLEGIAAAVPRLNQQQADVLVAPPSVLRGLSQQALSGALHGSPRHVIAVAEVLEPSDRDFIRAAWQVECHSLYQATEGFLGYSCERGTLHLNETFVHIEPEWLDPTKTRFTPIVTDFTRETQLIVRYRLNDVLRVAPTPCPCGRAERSIAAIEGRADEVLWLPTHDQGHAAPIYADFVRRAMLLAGPEIEEYDVTQNGLSWLIALKTPGEHRSHAMACVHTELHRLWRTLGVVAPSIHFMDWRAPTIGDKRRRIRCIATPEGLSCRY